MALVVVVLAGIAVEWSGSADAQPAERRAWSYADHIGEMDVVGEATIIAPDDSTINLLLRVDQLFAGTVASRTLRLTVLSESTGAAAGAKVFFWGLRLHEKHWALYGRYLLVGESGELSGIEDRQFLRSPDGSRALSAVEMRSKLEEAVRPGAMNHFARISALVPAIVTSVMVGTPPRGVTCEAIPIDGVAGALPDTLTVVFTPRRRAGWGAPAIGDTLVLPIKDDLVSGHVALPTAPDRCVVRDGYVRALGLPYALRMNAYRVVDGRLHLRPIQERDAPSAGADE